MNTLILLISLVLNQVDKPREALIPFATEAYTSKYMPRGEAEWIKKSLTKKNEPETISGNVITIGYSNLADHLVESHDCPRWVVDLYSPDPVLLWRIHKGYELQSYQKDFKETDDPLLKAYYAKRWAEYGRDFQVMKVIEKK